MSFYSRYKFWIETYLFSLLVFVASGFYIFLTGGTFDLVFANRALAASAIILVGLSFALSGITYFTPFFHKRLAYRKQLGVIGFAYGLTHAVISLFFLKPVFIFPASLFQNPIPFVFSTLTIILFAVMTIVSNFGIPQKIGAQTWRKILRSGYIGIVFLMIHFGILSLSEWKLWFLFSKPILPPISLLLFIFSTFVLILRLALFISLKKRKTSSPIQNPNN